MNLFSLLGLHRFVHIYYKDKTEFRSLVQIPTPLRKFKEQIKPIFFIYLVILKFCKCFAANLEDLLLLLKHDESHHLLKGNPLLTGTSKPAWTTGQDGVEVWLRGSTVSAKPKDLREEWGCREAPTSDSSCWWALMFFVGVFLFKHLYQNSREPLGLSIKVSGAFLQTFPLQTCTKSPNTYVWWSCELQRPDQAHRSASNHTFPSYWSYCCVKKKVRSPLYTFMNWLASFWLIRSSPRAPILGKSWMFRSHMQLYSPVL